MARTMSDEHKAALAVGRAQGRAVRNYLEALESSRPKRGRRRTPDTIRKRLAGIENELQDADPVKRVQLAQERLDLQAELARSDEVIDISDVEDAFVKAAAEYSDRKGIGYKAWREVGVPAAVLRRAGISRG